MIKIADVLEEYTYKEGQCIIRQVTMKDKIYQKRQQNNNKKVVVEKKFFDQMIFLGSYWRHILHHQRRPSKGETKIDLI